MNRTKNERGEMSDGMLATIGVLVVLAIVVGLVLGLMFGVKAFNRHQRIADAKNEVTASQIEANNQTKLNEIRINQQAQLVKVAKQKAQIRLENAIGVREAQDEISKTLTPLYVQFEALEAMRDMAKYGNSTIYIPSGSNGIPLVSGVAGQPSVGGSK